jgi:bacteriorhodopsin
LGGYSNWISLDYWISLIKYGWFVFVSLGISILQLVLVSLKQSEIQQVLLIISNIFIVLSYIIPLLWLAFVAVLILGEPSSNSAYRTPAEDVFFIGEISLCVLAVFLINLRQIYSK